MRPSGSTAMKSSSVTRQRRKWDWVVDTSRLPSAARTDSALPKGLSRLKRGRSSVARTSS